jgi:arsenical pump membrane protein
MRLVAVIAGACLLGVALALTPLGALGQPLVLVIVLPPLGRALASLGWAHSLAVPLRSSIRPSRRPMLLFLLWSAISTLLTLDVAAVVAVDVGLDVAGDDPAERSEQVRAAVLGANAGSFLLPFSNLTNIVMVATLGLGFTEYVAAAAPIQLVMLIVGVLLLSRPRHSDGIVDQRPEPTPAPVDERTRSFGIARWMAGSMAVGSAVVAVIVGLSGGNVALPFAAASAVAVAASLAVGATLPGTLARSVPWLTTLVLAVVIAAHDTIAQLVPFALPADPTLANILLATAVGGGLSAIFNNLPAAIIGTVLLQGAGVPVVLGFLIGTNVISILTPHGSVATILSHSVARHRGWTIRPIAHVRRMTLDVASLASAGLIALRFLG